MDIASPLTFLAVDLTEEFVGAFVAFWVLIGMFIVLMLPVLAIPYIFIKMGSIAGKVQGKLNQWGRGARGAAMGAAKREAKGAAGRAWERKQGQWAARGVRSNGKRDLRGTIGGYKTQRDFKRSQISAEAKRLQEEGLAKRITSDPRYSARAGGDRALAVARGIQEKRLKEEDENAVATLRAAGVYHPGQLTEIAAGGEAKGVTGEKINGAGSEALQRVAIRQLVSAQDSDALDKIMSTNSATNKTMLYEEIQKQYSTAKGAGAHFVKFDPSQPDQSAGWDVERTKQEAVNALGSLSFEKLVAQDSKAAQRAWAGFAEGKGAADKRSALQAAAQQALASPEILRGAKLEVRVALEGIAKGTPPPAAVGAGSPPPPTPTPPTPPPTPPTPPPTPPPTGP